MLRAVSRRVSPLAALDPLAVKFMGLAPSFFWAVSNERRGARAVFEKEVHHRDAGEALGKVPMGIQSFAEGLGRVQDGDEIILGHLAETRKMADGKRAGISLYGICHG
jgi:hypothetical protein